MAALGGAAVGMERQWSGHADGPRSRFAGIRTFTLLGGLAGIAGWLWTSGYPVAAAVILSGAVALIVAGYIAASRQDPEATTEAAALIVVAAGVLSGIGSWTLGSGIIVVTAILLVEKSRLHSWVEKISDVGLKAGFRFALMAVVILPLLPEGPYGPFGGIRPRELWIIVLMFSGISFGAYIIRSLLGAGPGYVVTGLLGGLVSSTNVTLSFSRMQAKDTKSEVPRALGVVAACTMLYFRVAAAAAFLNPALGRALLPWLAIPAAIGGLYFAYGLRRAHPAGKESQTRNPLQFRTALQMAGLFQVVLFAMTFVGERFGQTGLLVSGAILGFTDVDALTISMAKAAGGGQMMQTAVLATLAGITSNNVLKLGLTLVLGRRRYRTVAALGLALLTAATIAPILIFGGAMIE